MYDIDAINKLICQNGYEAMRDEIEAASVSSSPFVRAELAVLLCDFPNSFSEQILLKLLYDKNRNVRLEAVDSISVFKSEKVYRALFDICNDKYSMIRAYAMLAFGYVTPRCKSDDTRFFLRGKLRSEKNAFVKICIRCALYYLGQKEEFVYLIKNFGRYGYANQCSIINFAIELTETNLLDICITKQTLNDLKVKAKGRAVEAALQELEYSMIKFSKFKS